MTGVLNINTFLSMVGKRAVRFWVYIEIIVARLPTLRDTTEPK